MSVARQPGVGGGEVKGRLLEEALKVEENLHANKSIESLFNSSRGYRCKPKLGQVLLKKNKSGWWGVGTKNCKRKKKKSEGLDGVDEIGQRGIQMLYRVSGWAPSTEARNAGRVAALGEHWETE